ncbi:RNA 3'-terminal phosphate cyclase [Vibrio nigripulchritudo]|uniref:RNA 3'-terminal phosphate cyclase n=1 Tax=Vibrio nigripulchritudo TaxID=28173 RepID=UPI0005FA06B4|nr:RNA 3'-terminal phosphate cyclase [Vibrio nigripulchritudo]KJY68562.1 hypothetical protein TW74_25740 [Vibrio nigripulchritudo]
MEITRVDGSMGEGGGQVLRTSLTLAMLQGKKLEITNIRANRKKPGLMRQHLTCIQAAKAVSNAKVEGDELGSDCIVFEPNSVQAGEYEFSIGTAGSTVLVCQTILLPLLLANEKSIVLLEGGTHNGLSPSLTFFEESYLKALGHFGISADIKKMAIGFNPAGGGKWEIQITPIPLLNCVHFKTQAEVLVDQSNCEIETLISGVARSIATREITATRKKLGWFDAQSKIEHVDSIGSGNSLHMKVMNEPVTTIFETVGQYGISAERVAARCAGRMKAFLKSGAAIEEHLADQLLLPMALAGKSSMLTTKPSSHTLTNIRVIEIFTGKQFLTTQINENLWEISVC